MEVEKHNQRFQPPLRSNADDDDELCPINRDLTNCEAQFDRYQWMREIGKNKGAYGVIYEVYNKKRQHLTALKVQVYLETFPSARARCDAEMIIACRVSGLAGFLRLYDYWICDVWPQDHVFRRSAKKTHLADQRKLFYIEMQLAAGTQQDLIDERTPLSRID